MSKITTHFVIRPKLDEPNSESEVDDKQADDSLLSEPEAKIEPVHPVEPQPTGDCYYT